MVPKLVRNSLAVLIVFVMLALTVPSTAFGQGRGRRHRRGSIHNSNWKCGKFVNCHDARDGRIDGRGPDRDRFGNIIGVRRRHRRNWDNDDYWRNRRVRRDRNFDRDLVMRGRRHGRR
jgi:hypothetical protein